MAFISFICIILRYLCSLQEFLPKSLHFNCPHWIVAGISIDYFHTLQPELFPRILHLVHDTARRLVPKECWAPENWCFPTVVLGRTLESPLDSKGTKKSVSKEISPEYLLEGVMLKLKIQYFDHLMRRAYSLGKTPMLGKNESKGKRGWQRMRSLDSIADSMDMRLSKLREIMKGREAWHAAAHGVAKN